jgi:5-formyltetrahydrofolate cyclo-ligase
MRSARRAIPADERARAGADVVARVLAVADAASARTVATFWPFGSEIPIGTLAAELAGRGTTVLLPYLESTDIALAAIDPHVEASTVPSGYGPRVPAVLAPVPVHRVDLVTVPGLAFDLEGHRLGYGGGHYDRLLHRLRDDALKVGVGFDVQVVDEVPHDAGDERVDLVITDRRTMRAPEAGPPVRGQAARPLGDRGR